MAPRVGPTAEPPLLYRREEPRATKLFQCRGGARTYYVGYTPRHSLRAVQKVFSS